jgi:hypothetical protein
MLARTARPPRADRADASKAKGKALLRRKASRPCALMKKRAQGERQSAADTAPIYHKPPGRFKQNRAARKHRTAPSPNPMPRSARQGARREEFSQEVFCMKLAPRRRPSINQLLGITQAKRRIAKATGIPTTKSGRKRKALNALTGGAYGKYTKLRADINRPAKFLKWLTGK